MSNASRHSRGLSRHIDSQNSKRHSRSFSVARKRTVTPNDAYLYALRVAYLSFLLQARPRRPQSFIAPRPGPNRSSTSIHDLMRDFSLVRDSKSTRYPHGFVSELERRLTGILMGKEKRKEYHDAMVKRTFGAFLNALKEHGFKKRMEKDRRVEDLVLIFFSNATKEFSKGRTPDDTSWKLMVDRHVALFVRLISLILKEHDWNRDKPELASRLSILEGKLLSHDQDLAEPTKRDSSSAIVEAPPENSEVKDMPLVQAVARIFGLRDSHIQSDLNKHKSCWTPKEALQDLKTYQTHLNLDTGKTLRSQDFQNEEAYEAWKKAEAPDLSQMMLAIVQSNPELAKTSPAGSLPQYNPQPGATISDTPSSEFSPVSSETSSYAVDQPVDISSMSLSDSLHEQDDGIEVFNFIPPDPRGYYRFVVMQAVSHDLQDQQLQASEEASESSATKLLSKQSTELLNEIALRWRIPSFTRAVLFLDVFREKYVGQEIDLDTLDSAFCFVKQPMDEKSKRSSFIPPAIYDNSKWTQIDIQTMQSLLSSLQETLLRDLYEKMMHCYDTKIPPLGSTMYVLENHVESDPSFIPNPELQEQFRSYAYDGLLEKAREVYQSHLDKEIPPEQESWEFHHVIQLGKGIMKLCQRIQKRYKRNPEVMGINLLTLLVNCVLPMFSEDSRDMVLRIMQAAQEKGEIIEMQEGFDLYQELSEVRRVYMDVLPGETFPFNLEEHLAEFVWRWIQATGEHINNWVDQAVKQDNFTVRTESPNEIPTDDQRHSVSVMDIFRSFNQVIERIVQLNWDDDVGYAKFMTAISKSICEGLGKYCEILEQLFGREMDRLSPEQEAAARQTKQEKWMQMAKEAWNSKEKIEPFQFLPESFVKLNNIEYALQQLDKLQREVNVDACADVLAKHAPPQSRRQRKVTSYVFTVKIVEAEDLKGCDMDGLSDPYVVLTDEYQKRISKSRVIYDNLNPRWDDTIDVMTKGPLNIIATIWDWDAIGDHDYVGRTSLKLDPAHFADFGPREYWLDLDTQGRLLLRVSMEGERDDIQFYYGKAFRALKRTEREMTRKTTEKLSAYINHCLSRRALKTLLSRGISISSVSSYFNRTKTQTQTGPSQAEIEGALETLFTYFDDNFSIMNKTLTTESMRTVMARLWKEVLVTIEGLLVPPLSDKPSNQRPLSQQEAEIVSRWLELLLNFFNAVDDETGEANGVPMDVLKSPKYHEIQTLFFFYFEPTDHLIRTSERMASANSAHQQANRNQLSVSAASRSSFGGAGMLAGIPAARRGKSIMVSRNLGTMRKAKEEKRREAQAEPNDDMVLRILRMRPEAAGYLRDRSRQKERLATAAAADLIVKQSLMAGGGGRMTGTLPR